MVFIAWIWIVAFRVHPGTYEAQAQLAIRDRLHAPGHLEDGGVNEHVRVDHGTLQA
jgi:hypothetical protein